MMQTFPTPYQSSDWISGEVAMFRGEERPPIPLVLGHLCLGCGPARMTMIKIMPETEFADWKAE